MAVLALPDWRYYPVYLKYPFKFVITGRTKHFINAGESYYYNAEKAFRTVNGPMPSFEYTGNRLT